MQIDTDNLDDAAQIDVTENDGLEELEIDLDAEGGAAEKPKQQPAAAADEEDEVDPADDVGERPRRRGGDARSRINRLTREKHEAQTVNQRLLAELEQARSRAAQLEDEKRVADRAAMVHYEAAVKANLADAKRAYQEAVASGDVAAQADANERVARLTADQAEIDRFKQRSALETERAEPEPRRPAQPSQPQPQPVARMAPETQAWVEANTWFQPNHPDFDEEMHIEARDFGVQLERRLMRQGRQNEIGSAEYFKQITDHLRQEFPDYDFGDETPQPKPKPTGNRTPQMEKQRTGTLGAGRGGGAAATAGGGGSKVTLSAEERRFARSLASNGALTNNGKRISDPAEAERLYALQKRNTVNQKGA